MEPRRVPEPLSPLALLKPVVRLLPARVLLLQSLVLQQAVALLATATLSLAIVDLLEFWHWLLPLPSPLASLRRVSDWGESSKIMVSLVFSSRLHFR